MPTAKEGPDAHVVFNLEVDDTGWPPAASERLWAFELGDNYYRIDNVPWFVRDIAVGDVVHAVQRPRDPDPIFRSLVRRSGNVTVRVICYREGPFGGDLDAALAVFTKLGVYGEGAPQYRMLALSIEPDAPVAAIVETLRVGEADGSWEYEEGRVTRAWIDATGE